MSRCTSCKSLLEVFRRWLESYTEFNTSGAPFSDEMFTYWLNYWQIFTLSHDSSRPSNPPCQQPGCSCGRYPDVVAALRQLAESLCSSRGDSRRWQPKLTSTPAVSLAHEFNASSAVSSYRWHIMKSWPYLSHSTLAIAVSERHKAAMAAATVFFLPCANVGATTEGTPATSCRFYPAECSRSWTKWFKQRNLETVKTLKNQRTAEQFYWICKS